MVKVAQTETKLRTSQYAPFLPGQQPNLPKLIIREQRVKRIMSDQQKDSLKLFQLRQILKPLDEGIKLIPKESADDKKFKKSPEAEQVALLPDVPTRVDSLNITPAGPCPVCEARTFAHGDHSDKDHKDKAVTCKCPVCETVNKRYYGKLPKLLYKNQAEEKNQTIGVSPRLLTKLQLNQQMSMLRAVQDLSPMQMYSNRMIRFKLMQNHRRQTMPMRLQNQLGQGHVRTLNMSFPDYVAKFRRKMVEIRSRFRENARLGLYADYWVPPYPGYPISSSSTPTVPYSTADILYGNEVRHSPQLDEIRQNSFIDFTKERERQNSRDIGDIRRPNSKGGSRKSLSIEKVSIGKDSEDGIRPGPTLPSTKHNQYRPNGLRNTLIKGEQLFSSRSNGITGRETEDLVAMGTIWSPNTQTSPVKNSPLSASMPTPNPASSTASGTMQSVASTKTQSVGTTGSNSSTAISQTRKYGTSSVRPIMVQNAPTSRNVIRDVEPKYTDPLIGAPASFQQRLMELSALEAETVRYEKNKRVKKKVKQDRDS